MDDKQLLALIKGLSLRQKARLCSGADGWHTEAIPEKGIPSLFMADGPHGLRVEDPKNAKQNGGASRPATCFPSEVALACSFSPTLTQQVGEAIAEECLAEGVGMILGPGVNIKRSPLGGRNFEYYSEDPLLAGEMAAGFINGAQEKGVGASLKHYAVNNQETYRMSINAAIDERALWDVYLKPFGIAVRKAQPATVMASYNRVNGQYATQHRRLLTQILRLAYGFNGAVVSDWGAVYDRPAGIEAGMDLEMPASGHVNDYAIEQAVKNGALSADALDTAVWNILRLVFRYAKTETAPCDYEAHHRLAVDAAAKSAVLLKNDGMLPLGRTAKIALIGEMAQKPRYQGGGSSVINPKNLVGLRQAMEQAGLPFRYAPGYAGGVTSSALLAEAEAAAKEAEAVVLVIGLPDSFECEGMDRRHLSLPEGHLRLLEAVAKQNENLCVVLCCGAPVATPWLKRCNALLLPHLAGEGVGEAVVKLLYGDENPAGKLAESWPLRLEDTPCAHHFPQGPNEVRYNESIYVGYRYYDTVSAEVRFPFGHGLSYSSFSYSGLRLSHEELGQSDTLRLHFTLTNTGERRGEEIAQAYLRHINPAAFQPAHELKAFGRFALEPGESREVSLEIKHKALGYWDTASKTHFVAEGEYEVQVGPSSRELPLAAVFRAKGGRPNPPPAQLASAPYGQIKDNRFPGEEFAKIYGRPFLSNEKPRQGGYTDITPLGLMDESRVGRAVARLAVLVSRKTTVFSSDPEVNRKAADAMAKELPFKNLVLHTGGLLSPAAAQKLLDVCNKTGSLCGFVAALCRKKHYRN